MTAAPHFLRRAERAPRKLRPGDRPRSLGLRVLTEAERTDLGAARRQLGAAYRGRPKTWGDCQKRTGPCGFVSCSMNLYLDVDDLSGAVKLNFPDREIDELAETCALRVAQAGGLSLEEVGKLTNLSQERVSQIEESGLRNGRRAVNGSVFRDDVGGSGPLAAAGPVGNRSGTGRFGLAGIDIRIVGAPRSGAHLGEHAHQINLQQGTKPMAALTGPRNTRERGDYCHSEEQFAKTNVIFYQGQMVAVDATGYLVPAITSTALKRPGRVNLSPLRKVDNTGIASGAVKLKIEFGEFFYNNSTSGDLIAQADVGNSCYIVDDNTVAKTDGSTSRSIAGKIMEVEAGGVWVLQLPA